MHELPKRIQLPLSIAMARETRASLDVTVRENHLVAKWKKGAGPEIRVHTLGISPEQTRKMMEELQEKAAVYPAIDIDRRVEKDSDGDEEEDFYVDHEAGAQRWHGHVDRPEAWQLAVAYGVTREEFEQAFGASEEPEKCYTLPGYRKVFEPEWRNVEDRDDSVWISEQSFGIKTPDGKANPYFFWFLELQEQGENKCEVEARIGLIPAWSALTPAQRELVMQQTGVNSDGTEYIYLAQATHQARLILTVHSIALRWEEVDAEAENFHLEDEQDKVLHLVRLAFDDQPDLEEIMQKRVNGIGQDGWSYLFEDLDSFLKRTASANMSPERSIINRMHGIDDKKLN